MLSASDRFIVTCIGKSIKNNAPVPFVTPLAEFVDMCLDADASPDERDKKQSQFVFDHPRHAMSSNNFISDKVVPGKIWGHNQASFTAGLALGTSTTSQVAALTAFNVEQPECVTVDELVNVLDYPEDFFMNTIGVSKWSNKVQADTALLPIDIDTRRLRELWNELRELSETTSQSSRRTSKSFTSEDVDTWKSTKMARGAIPVGVFGEEALLRAKELFEESSKLVTQWGFPSMVETERDISLELPHGVVTGSVSCFENEKLAGFVSLYGVERLRSRAAVLLLLLAAQGIVKHSVIVFGYDAEADEIKVNNVYCADELTQEEAIRRLSTLIDAIRIARSVPAVQFGGTIKAISASDASSQGAQSPEFVFDRFVSSDEYGKSLERRLFGEEPKFLDVFSSQSPLLNFWRTLKQAVDGPKYKSFAKHGITTIKVSGYVVK
jgi:exonuclease V gamma subunit